LERKEIAGKSIADYGAIIIVENRIAPEHLELCAIFLQDPTMCSFGFYEEKQHYFIYKRCPSKG